MFILILSKRLWSSLYSVLRVLTRHQPHSSPARCHIHFTHQDTLPSETVRFRGCTDPGDKKQSVSLLCFVFGLGFELVVTL